MKLLLKVRNINNGNEWTEDYDKPNVRTMAEAKKWGKDLIDWFNYTARPGDSKREYLGVELAGEPTAHVWVKRTDGMSKGRNGADLYFCIQCHMTGKRLMGRSTVARDSKFRAKKFEVCAEVKLLDK